MEEVLVVKTSHMEKHLVQSGLISSGYEPLLESVKDFGEYIPRPRAEDDPAYKQIIPYVAIIRKNEIFTLERLNKGTEKRLHGFLSVGIGGHINPSDGDPRSGDNPLESGLLRELSEEVLITGEYSLSFAGVINDDSNSVGTVHLGFFYILKLSGEVTVREADKLAGRWMTAEALSSVHESLETWSQIALPRLSEGILP